MDALEYTHLLMDQALARAKKANRLNKSATRRLKSFPLWKRVLFYRRFKDFKKFIVNQEWERFACTATALNLARRIKFYERRQKQLKDEQDRRNTTRT